MSSGSRIATVAAEPGPRGLHTAWLALGSNVGDRAHHLRRAVALLDDVMRVEQVSGIYETEPYGYADQPRFWNMAVRGTTDLPALDLLEELQDIERRLGRQPTFRMGPRVIDIDIILLGDIILEHEMLRIPHPGMMDRSFVLLPLLELDPGLLNPTTGERLAERAARLDASGIQRLGGADVVLGQPTRT